MITKNIAKKRRAYIFTMSAFMTISAFLTCALVIFLVVYVLAKGITNIT